MLTARRLGHRFANRVLFRDVDVTLSRGEILFIEGPSGVGKSTLLLILGGLLAPTDGVVRSDPEGGIAWVLQDMNGLASRTVLDNARLYALVDGRASGAAEAGARRALDAVDLIDRLDARARTLSGGENQRLCVARALACDRALVLADEPTSQLDRANAQIVMSALADEAQRGRAVVVVTHDLDAIPVDAPVARLGDDGLVLRPGTPTTRGQ